MSERRLKLGHRKEYKRKSKHTRNPSYYPRHLTKVTLADFDADFYRPRLLGHYWCMVNGTPVELPVYHVRDARDYIRWWLDGKQGRVPGTREVVKVDTYQQLFRPGTHAYEQAVKFDNNWVYLPIPCSKGGYIGETSKHFMHLETE